MCKTDIANVKYLPMNGNVVGNMIDNLDQNRVTLSSSDTGARELSINSHHALGVAQSGHVLQPYLNQKEYNEQNISNWCHENMVYYK